MPNYRTTYRSSSARRTGSASRWGRAGSTTGRGTWWPRATYSPTQFRSVREEIQARVNSFRTLNQQFSGTGRVTGFSPTTASQWINFINDGCYVYKFTNPEFCRYFGYQWSNSSPTAAFRWLRSRFGSGIKAVTRGKGNNWLICASPNVTARPFSTYQWK